MKLAAKPAVPALVKALDDPSADVRARAADALYAIGTPEAKKAADDSRKREADRR
jgi:HEAT repeat protein